MPELKLSERGRTTSQAVAKRRARSIELASGNERYTPALALTAFTQIERERLMAAGFADRVNKPVDAEKLITAIRAALRTEQRAKAVTS